MEFSKFINKIRIDKNSLARTWSELVGKSEYMEKYKELEKEVILERGEAVFTHLANWLESGASNDVAEEYFESVGQERFKEGFPLSEVVYAHHLVKKIFWSSIAWDKGFVDQTESTKCENCVEFWTILNNYFDLGNFYITRGYFQSIFENIDGLENSSVEEFKKYLKHGSIDSDDLDKEKFIWRHV